MNNHLNISSGNSVENSALAEHDGCGRTGKEVQRCVNVFPPQRSSSILNLYLNFTLVLIQEDEKLKLAGISDRFQAEIPVEDREVYRKIFDFCDADSSGTIENEELVDVLQKLDSAGLPNSAPAIIEEVDVDSDGRISWLEFQHAVLNLHANSKFNAFVSGLQKTHGSSAPKEGRAEDEASSAAKEVRELEVRELEKCLSHIIALYTKMRSGANGPDPDDPWGPYRTLSKEQESVIVWVSAH